MASSSKSSRVPSCSFSSEQTHSNPSEARDVGCSSQAVDLVSRQPCYLSYEWVDPRVLDIPTRFRGFSALNEFLSKVSMLKSNSPPDVVAIDNCNHIDRICHGRKNGHRDFFFAYTCLFNDLHITLLFDEFTMKS